MKKQKVNNARAKRRIKLLKLKNFCKRVIDKRAQRLAKLRKPKGRTIVGRAIDYAEYIPIRYGGIRGTKNQRQKRKIWRQAPHIRKRA